MYLERVRTLKKAYKVAQKNNRLYEDARNSVARCEVQLGYIQGLEQSLKVLNAIIAQRENAWRDGILRTLEADITEALSYVYPGDGYRVRLTSRVLRGSVRVEASVTSFFAGAIRGNVEDSQGRLFQQVVSFAALASIMHVLGIDTVYVDEAFSGAAKANIAKVNALLQYYSERGMNLIIIAQDTSMANGIDANVLLLERSLDNKTTVRSGTQGNGL